LCSVLTGYDGTVESESILSLSDAAGGLVILLAFLSSFMFIAKKMLVSVTPVILVTSGFFIVGMFLYLPVSPFYIPSDASYYQAWGYSLSDYWAGEGPMVDRQIWPGKGFWPLIIAALHFFLGPIYVAAIAFNSGVFGLMILALQKSILLLSSKSGSWVLGFLVATSTPFALFGPSLLRESLFWLGASGGVLGISYLARREVRNGLLSLSWAVFLLLAIRPDAGAVIAYSFVGAAIVLFGLAGPFQSKRKKILSALALTGLLVSFPPASSFLIPIMTPLMLKLLQAASPRLISRLDFCLFPEMGRVCSRMMGRVCSRMMGRVCSRMMGRVCSRMMGRVCSRMMGRVCSRMMGRVCSRMMGRVCSRMMGRVCSRMMGRVCSRMMGRVCSRMMGVNRFWRLRFCVSLSAIFQTHSLDRFTGSMGPVRFGGYRECLRFISSLYQAWL